MSDFRVTVDSESLRSAITHVDRTVKRGDQRVSLVASGKGGGTRLWLEGHGPFRHLQVAVDAAEIHSKSDPRGITMDQKVLQGLARGPGSLSLAAKDESAQFRRRGGTGDLTGRLGLEAFDGSLTNPKAEVEDGVDVSVTGPQAKDLADALKALDITNAIAKGKGMDLWIKISPKGCRLLVFDGWHAALVSLPSVTSDSEISVRVDKELFAAAVALPGDGWSMAVGPDVVRASNSEFALRSATVAPEDGPTASDMLKVMGKSVKAADKGQGVRMAMPTSLLRDVVQDLGVSGHRADSIDVGDRKGRVGWSCRTQGGTANVSLDPKAVKAEGKWPEGVKLSPNLLSDVVRVMPDDSGISVHFLEDTCLMRTEDGLARYLILLS